MKTPIEDHDPNVHQEYAGGNNPELFYKANKKFPKLDMKRGKKLAEVHWFQFNNWGRPRGEKG